MWAFSIFRGLWPLEEKMETKQGQISEESLLGYVKKYLDAYEKRTADGFSSPIEVTADFFSPGFLGYFLVNVSQDYDANRKPLGKRENPILDAYNKLFSLVPELRTYLDGPIKLTELSKPEGELLKSCLVIRDMARGVVKVRKVKGKADLETRL